MLATPKDPAIHPREIASVDPSLHSVRLHQVGDEVLAVPIGANSAPEIASTDVATDIAQIVAGDAPETEKARLVMARRGQGLFRARVEMLEPRCRVTGITDRAHLRAGHIKPWRDCTNLERLDGNNGLLLAPHIDHLFDRGFISFDASGRMLTSPRLHPDVLRAWGIDPTKASGAFIAAQTAYLEHHHANCFLHD